tara:strand:- start:2 stop:298 length:297 start_codon:yes stop_codon:yes gene_type:complete
LLETEVEPTDILPEVDSCPLVLIAVLPAIVPLVTAAPLTFPAVEIVFSFESGILPASLDSLMLPASIAFVTDPAAPEGILSTVIDCVLVIIVSTFTDP